MKAAGDKHSDNQDMAASNAELFRHPHVRNELVTALASLVMIFGLLLAGGSDMGALLTMVFGLAGVFLRWTAAPLIVVALAVYLSVVPTGLPTQPLLPFSFRPPLFRIEDLILAAASLTFVASQYRLFIMLDQAIPSAQKAKDRKLPTSALRRPPGAVPPGELGHFLSRLPLVVLLAQGLWLLLARVELSVGNGYGLSFLDDSTFRPGSGGLASPWSRFVLLITGGFLSVMALNAYFTLWRYRQIPRDEAQMMMLDILWREHHREFARLANWRAWYAHRRKTGMPAPAAVGGTPRTPLSP